MIHTIFKFFALKFSERTSIKVLENKCENKASLWTDFKNSFAWLTGMKNMIFCFYNFFCSGHFLIIFPKVKDQKMTGAKKMLNPKITFFMPVNHAKEFLKSVHAVALFSWLFLVTLAHYCFLIRHFSKKKFYWKIISNAYIFSCFMERTYKPIQFHKKTFNELHSVFFCSTHVLCDRAH